VNKVPSPRRASAPADADPGRGDHRRRGLPAPPGRRPAAHAVGDPVLADTANTDGNSVSVVDTATNTVTTTIAVGTGPHAVTVSPDGTRVYTAKTVACTLTGPANGANVTNTFTAQQGVLTLGTLPTTATRTAGAPTDPSPANDTTTKTCTALTSLVITC